MIRASALQRRAPYVCADCRSKLSRSGLLRSSSPWHIRALSTSASLRNSGGFRPSGSLGQFGGAKAGAFGAFAKKAPRASEERDENGLLPHEAAARAKAPVAPKSPPPPPPPSQSQSQSPKQQQKRNGQGNRQDLSPSYTQQSPSLTELSDVLGKNTPRSTIPNDSRTNRLPDQASGPKVSKIDRSKPHWGAFKTRRVETQLPTPAGLPPSARGNAFNAPAQAETATKAEDAKGSSPRPAPKPITGNVWDALESAASKNMNRARGRAEEALTHGKAGEAKLRVQEERFRPPPVEGQSPKAVKKSSRFDEGRDDVPQVSRKNKKDKKSKRGGFVGKMEEMEEDADYWEARRQREAEKKARKAQEALEPEEVPAVPIFLPEFISVSRLGQSLKQPIHAFLRDLEEMGFEDLTEDTIMTGETASLIAMEYGFDPTVDDGSKRDMRPRPAPEDITLLPHRPPVVTIMGHVDHGKTTLLDYLRKSSVAAQEHGGITQHIGAFVVQMTSGKPITFLDTPGHAAFLTMRQRGANVTDIVVLVVAADDSVKPQTIEAIKHAQGANVPIIVAINKIDKEDARIDQVKADLARNGVEIEDYGGDVQVVPVSGKTGQGMEDLEENIVTLSEILDVRAEHDGLSEGWILESSVKQDGKVATVLVKRGTLRLGDIIVAGKTFAKIRLMRNEAGGELNEAPPGTPVEILGWRQLPDAGQLILQAPDEHTARTAVEYRQEMADREESSKQLVEQEQREREAAIAKELAELGDSGDTANDADAGTKLLQQNFVIKADVAGSVEAVLGTVLEQGNNEVSGRVLRQGAGQITEFDVDHAAHTGSVIINFNNAIQPHIKDRADQNKVRIIDRSVIYHVVDEVREILSDLLPPNIIHKMIGEADVLQTFDINIRKKVFRTIAGCRVRNGNIRKGSLVKILRKDKVIYEGKIDTLKHVKKDVQEMGKGSECGIGFENFQALKEDDQIRTYEVVEEKRTL